MQSVTALCFDLLQGYESLKLDLFLEIPHYFSGSTKHTMHNFILQAIGHFAIISFKVELKPEELLIIAEHYLVLTHILDLL